uniref:Long-chain-fatty-acid--CoA ligase n=1 Tax=Arcella intermedia TaxID=1963864 RepID=A0A6B2KZD5_9EUKA
MPAERKGESQVIRHYMVKEGEELWDVEKFESKTLHEAFMNALKNYPNNPFLGTRVGDDYQWLNYAEVAKRSQAIGSGLLALGFEPHAAKVGISSINRLEWNLIEYACNGFSLCLVPLYDTLGKEGVLHITTECKLSVVFCNAEKVKTLVGQFREAGTVRVLITYTPLDAEQKKLLEEEKITVYSLEEVEKMGNEKLQAWVAPDVDEIATICYTSGTTGLPKGVELSHRNFVTAAYGLSSVEVKVDHTDVHVSYLPSAHVFERVMAAVVVMVGARMGYYSGDPRKLFDDLVVLKPTIFVTVPRLLGRLYDKVMEAVAANGISKAVFDQAYESKLGSLREGYLTHKVWDPMVFAKIKEKLGGNVRFIITGSAPLAPNLMDFLRICFCCPVLEGYGQTETACGGTRNLLWDTDTGHVGVPSPTIEIKLVDVPEMNYFATDDPPRGEICFRGPTCSKGYFNNPEKTKELIDENGWTHSGDVGCIFPNGNVKIIDRVKNLFKLSIGEYIAPEKIEQIFTQSKWVAQAFVHGESLKASLVAVLVPDHEVLLKWAEETAHESKGNFEALCADPKVNKLIMEDITALGKKFDLKSFEFPKKIFLSHQIFSVENDLLTPTFKLKRPQAKAAYKAQLEELYQGLE